MPTWKPSEQTFKKDLGPKWPTMAHYQERQASRPSMTPKRRANRVVARAKRAYEMHLKDQQRLAPMAMRCLTRGMRALAA